MADSLWPHGLQPTRLLCPWDFPGENTGVGCHFLLQGIFPIQESNPHLLHCRQILYHWATSKALTQVILYKYKYICIYIYTHIHMEVAQSCPTLGDPMNCSLPGSSIHGIFQARILESVAIAFSKRSSRPREWTQVSRVVGRRFTVWAAREMYSIVTQIF